MTMNGLFACQPVRDGMTFPPIKRPGNTCRAIGDLSFIKAPRPQDRHHHSPHHEHSDHARKRTEETHNHEDVCTGCSFLG